MCSACSGDYENPDVTTDRESTEDECNLAILLGAEAEESESCTHELPDGSSAGSINLALCGVECGLCGAFLMSLNPFVSRELRVEVN